MRFAGLKATCLGGGGRETHFIGHGGYVVVGKKDWEEVKMPFNELPRVSKYEDER